MGSVRESISLLVGVPSFTPNSSLTHQWREPPVLGCPFSQFEMFDFHLSDNFLVCVDNLLRALGCPFSQYETFGVHFSTIWFVCVLQS